MEVSVQRQTSHAVNEIYTTIVWFHQNSIALKPVKYTGYKVA